MNKDKIETREKNGVSELVQARLRKMLQFIEQNYDKKISLEDIALSANISKSETLRCFKMGMQMSPFGYLIGYRLELAKERLLTTKDSVSKIALAREFENASYFNRKFKREYGITPNQLRRQMG